MSVREITGNLLAAALRQPSPSTTTSAASGLLKGSGDCDILVTIKRRRPFSGTNLGGNAFNL
jgi:hypothetical protein